MLILMRRLGGDRFPVDGFVRSPSLLSPVPDEEQNDPRELDRLPPEVIEPLLDAEEFLPLGLSHSGRCSSGWYSECSSSTAHSHSSLS